MAIDSEPIPPLRVAIGDTAASVYRRLGDKLQQRVIDKVKAVLAAVETNPETRGLKHLKHDRQGQQRTKVGNLVVIFVIDRETNVAIIEQISPRGHGYDR